MDIHSFFGASSSVASSSTDTETGSNCSDSDSGIAEPPSMKACRELFSLQQRRENTQRTGKTSSSG